jgi:hypothetical protein
MEDYTDPYWAGRLEDILTAFEKKLYLYRITGKTVAPDGSINETKQNYTIYGSLQTWRRTRNYSDDSVNTSSREGKLLVKYRYKLKDGDIVQKNNDFYRIVDVNDFDYAEVHDFRVQRLGLDEIQNYKFDEYLEEEFPEVI